MIRIITLALMLCFHLSHGQQQSVSGILKSSKGEVVAFASVVIRNAENKIITFKASDVTGSFSMILPSTGEMHELLLEINHLGFKKVSEPLVEGKDHYEIIMEEQSINLADVEVKSRPRLTSIGDTLTYDVASFAKQEDRAIADVLKRMPGMEVSDNGQVKFNGQNISSLYIDGDDLLDDKYAVGTKTIPYAMVQGVEVLLNHQPLKVLKNKVLSDKIAINLVIKDEAKLKLTGQAKLGAGLPHEYDAELNTILFNKKYKVLNVLEGNSIGKDLSSNMTGFDFSSAMSEMGNSRPSSILSTGTGGNPTLPKSRYFFNHSGALNANNLVNLENGLQLKATVNGLLSKDEMQYTSLSEYYFGQDTIRYTEQQEIVNHPFITEVSLNGKVNKDHYYLNNTFKVTYSTQRTNANLMNNGAGIQQRLTGKTRDFSNALTYVPELKNKDIVSINWYLNYFNSPQALRIHPGINPDVFNQGDPFMGIRQAAETPTWFNKASLGYQLTKGKVKQEYLVGVLNEFQRLNSHLRLKQLDSSESDYPASSDNQLRWNRNHVFAIGTYQYQKGALESELSLPLTLQQISYDDQGFNLKENEKQLLFNPTFRAKYFTGSEDYLSVNYRYKNQTGNITSIYRGAILANYRSLRANDAILNEEDSHLVGLQYNFRRSISMFFMNAGVSYNRARSNTIASNVVSDAISQTVLLSMVNNVTSIRANAGMSKFIFALGATADLKAFWSSTRYNQLFNEELLPFNNVSFVISPGMEARLWNRISMSYTGSASWMTSKLVRKESQLDIQDRQIQSLEQTVGLSYSSPTSLYIRMSGKHQYGKQPQSQDINYFFVDAFARYRIKALRTDIELNLSNLANIKRYESYHISANQYLYNQYQLRGRTIMMKFIFNL